MSAASHHTSWYVSNSHTLPFFLAPRRIIIRYISFPIPVQKKKKVEKLPRIECILCVRFVLYVAPRLYSLRGRPTGPYSEPQLSGGPKTC